MPAFGPATVDPPRMCRLTTTPSFRSQYGPSTCTYLSGSPSNSFEGSVSVAASVSVAGSVSVTVESRSVAARPSATIAGVGASGSTVMDMGDTGSMASLAGWRGGVRAIES